MARLAITCFLGVPVLASIAWMLAGDTGPAVEFAAPGTAPGVITTSSAPAAITAPAAPATQRTEHGVRGSCSLRGRVIDPRQVPVAGAHVCVLRSDAPGHHAETAADGTFALAIASTGSPTLTLVVHDPRWAPAIVAHGLQVHGAPVTDLGDIQLAGAGGIAGTVVDAQGRPCAQARLIVRPVHGPLLALPALELARWFPEQGVDGDGRFAVAGLPAGAYEVEAWAPGQDRRATPWCAVRAQTVTSLAPLALGPGCTLRGLVVDSAGRPVADAAIDLLPAAAPDLRGILRATTDADGAFAFAHLQAAPHHLRVRSPGHGPQVLRDLEPQHAPQLTIWLQAGGALHGRVLDAATSRGLPGSRVRLSRTDSTEDAQASESARLRATAAELQRAGREPEVLAATLRALADLEQQRRARIRDRMPFGAWQQIPMFRPDPDEPPDGCFRFADLEDGHYCVEVEVPGRETVRVGPVAVQAGAAPVLLEIAVPGPPAARR